MSCRLYRYWHNAPDNTVPPMSVRLRWCQKFMKSSHMSWMNDWVDWFFIPLAFLHARHLRNVLDFRCFVVSQFINLHKFASFFSIQWLTASSALVFHLLWARCCQLWWRVVCLQTPSPWSLDWCRHRVSQDRARAAAQIHNPFQQVGKALAFDDHTFVHLARRRHTGTVFWLKATLATGSWTRGTTSSLGCLVVVLALVFCCLLPLF